MSDTPIDRVAKATPPTVAAKIRGLSDRAIAWLFITPTIGLLLAINIFPADLGRSGSQFHQLPRQPAKCARWKALASSNYERVLTDSDVWIDHADHGAFRLLDHHPADADRLHARLSDRPQVSSGHASLDDRHPDPDDAVAGRCRKLLDVSSTSRRSASSITVVSAVTGVPIRPLSRCSATVSLAPWSIIIVDTWMWTPYRDADLPRRSALDPRLHLRGGRG